MVRKAQDAISWLSRTLIELDQDSAETANALSEALARLLAYGSSQRSPATSGPLSRTALHLGPRYAKSGARMPARHSHAASCRRSLRSIPTPMSIDMDRPHAFVSLMRLLLSSVSVVRCLSFGWGDSWVLRSLSALGFAHAVWLQLSRLLRSLRGAQGARRTGELAETGAPGLMPGLG
jgi:hypothetical protein